MNPNAQPLLVRHADGLLSAAVGDELLMMSAAEGKYFNLNDVGSRIWALLEQPMSIEALVLALTAEYHVDAVTAREHVVEFTSALRERGLLISGDATPSA